VSINNKIGLALSGGGQRAAAFHLGVLKKLHTLGILDGIKTISSISGGSIIAAYYLLYKDNFEKFYLDFIEKLKVNLEFRIFFARDFIWKLGLALLLLVGLSYCFITFHNYLFLVLLIPVIVILKYSLIIFPTGKSLQKVYDKVLYNGKLLNEIPDEPKIIINSTNLQTGTLMTFSKKEINDSSYLFKYGYVPKFRIEKVPVSFAVTASTSFAPFISPLRFRKEYIIDYKKTVAKKIRPELADGGIYDNQGIYKLNQEKLEIIICSDASSPYDRDRYIAINPFGLLMRTVNILMKRIRSFQFVNTIYELQSAHEIAYFAIDWQYKTCLQNFANNVLLKKVKENVLREHQLPAELLVYSSKEEKEGQALKIIEYINKRIRFDKIIENCLNPEEIQKISKINTRLRGLRKNEIDNLIRHGETMAEIHLKLYCPSLFKTSEENIS
jgi:NTE family protein